MCAAYFTFNFIAHFSKEKKRVGFFKNTRVVVFWLGPITITLKIIMDV